MINEKEDTICVYVYNVVVIQQMYDKKKFLIPVAWKET